jgi:hypothetical protein
MIYKRDACLGRLTICRVGGTTITPQPEMDAFSLKMDFIKPNALYIGGALVCIVLARV